MGRTTLFLLTLAASVAAAAPPPRGAVPPPGATRAAARFEELVAAGRKDQSELTKLLDELATLSQSYDWESDAARAEAKRNDLRGRIKPRIDGMTGSLASLQTAMRRFADEHGLETLERLADETTQGSPDIFSIMRAQTFHAQGVAFLTQVQRDLSREEDAWRRFRLMESERVRFRHIIWGLTLAFLAALAGLAYAFRLASSRRRRGPPPTNPGRPHRKGDIIDLRPE